jgi:pimeloyl-ACP methyl ester carboxylesterase
MAAATTLRTPLGRRVKVVEHGMGTPVVFLHSGVGSAGEWKQIFSLWPEGYRLVAIEAYRDGTGPGVDDGAMWPTSFALKRLTAAEEKKIGALVKKAAS